MIRFTTALLASSSALALIVACASTSGDSSTADSATVATPPAAGPAPIQGAAGAATALLPTLRPAESPPRSADEHLLRDMLDIHEGMILLAHSAMERRHEHRMDNDPALSEDVGQDAAKTEMLALLRSVYHDRHEPRPSAADSVAADSILHLQGDTYVAAFLTFMREHDERGLSSIDHALPTLRNPQVKALALRMRAIHLRDLQAKTTAVPGKASPRVARNHALLAA